MDAKHLEPHRKYLRQISEKERLRRREYYRLGPTVKETPPFVCLKDKIGMGHRKWREFLHPLDPVSLDDLKNWFGIPNHLARQKLGELPPIRDDEGSAARLCAVDKRLLPDKAGFSFEKLDASRRTAVQQMSRNLLYAHVSREDLRDPRIKAVSQNMVEIAKMRGPLLLAIPDLIVCPDDEIVFDKIAVLLFNNVIIYGNGRITTVGHTKIDAFHIQHVP